MSAAETPTSILPELDRITIVLKPQEGSTLNQVRQFASIGAPVAIGRGLSVIASCSEGDVLAGEADDLEPDLVAIIASLQKRLDVTDERIDDQATQLAQRDAVLLELLTYPDAPLPLCLRAKALLTGPAVKSRDEPAEQPAPKIKSLQWTDPAPPCEECRYDHVTAETPLGKFSIEWRSWKDWDSRSVFLDGEHLTCGDDLDQAKQAAANHYRSLIAACLSVEPIEQSPVAIEPMHIDDRVKMVGSEPAFLTVVFKLPSLNDAPPLIAQLPYGHKALGTEAVVFGMTTGNLMESLP